MTLDEAIEHLEDSIKNKEFSCESCKEEHKQLLEWLKELRNLSMHEMEEEEATDKMTESYIKQISEDYRAEIERLKQIIEIKDKQIDEYKKILKVQEQQTYMQKELILNLKYLLNTGR